VRRCPTNHDECNDFNFDINCRPSSSLLSDFDDDAVCDDDDDVVDDDDDVVDDDRSCD